MILFDLITEPESGCDDTILRAACTACAAYFEFRSTTPVTMPLLLQPIFRNTPSQVVYNYFPNAIFAVKSLNSSFGLVSSLRIGIPWNRVSIPDRAKNFSLRNPFSWEGCFVSG
jgi:hypothetical protein